jgi:hypothetical protein
MRPPSGHQRERWNVTRLQPTQAPHFLAMMVRAVRAVYLLAKSLGWLNAEPMRENLLASWR